MTQYLVSVRHAGAVPDLSPAELKQSIADVEALNERMQAEGVWVFAGGLKPAETATVVRTSGNDILITDGPYAETKEHLGGFWVIEAADLDAALGWAKLATVACRVPIEVRPFHDGPPEID